MPIVDVIPVVFVSKLYWPGAVISRTFCGPNFVLSTIGADACGIRIADREYMLYFLRLRQRWKLHDTPRVVAVHDVPV
jgi:hypothetical protein